MVKRTKSTSKRPWLVPLAVILVCVILGGGAWALSRQKNKMEASPVTPSSTASATPTPAGTKGNTGDVAKQQYGLDTPVPTSSAPTNSVSTIAVTISRAGQLTTGGPVQVRTIVTGAESGTCRAVFTGPSGQSMTASGNVSFQGGSTYDCDGLDMPASGFSPQTGWSVSVTATQGSNTSAPVSQPITFVTGV